MVNFSTRGLCQYASLAGVLILSSTNAYYVPGIKPETFKMGEEVPLKVNSITSIHTQMPKDYYRLPFCEPDGGPKMASENLGEFLTGNKIQTSPYTINMKKDVFCNVVCQIELTDHSSKVLKSHIRYSYHNNWIIDNLPSASSGIDVAGEEQIHYAGGFPIGYFHATKLDDAKVSKKEKKQKTKELLDTEAYVYNHVNIILDYHEPVAGDGFRVVGFSVTPQSIKHSFLGGYKWDGENKEVSTKKLATCDQQKELHTKSSPSTERQIVAVGEKILYTYDVIWKQSNVAWTSRWDVYLTENKQVPPQVHWYSISNSILVVLFLSLLVVSILIRSLKKDIAGYNSNEALTDEEKEDELDESGWKLIHADVFRPPQNYPMMYCVIVGSGAQITLAALACLLLAFAGFVNPSRRGSLMNVLLTIYMVCGCLAGYLSSRLYKTFKGRSWQLCTVFTAITFPGICFSMFLFFNIILAFFKSSGSVPFIDVLILAAMWSCVSIPLVFIGAFFGYKKDAFSYPTVTSTIARAIPPSTAILNPKFNMLISGLVPFIAAYVELFFIMTSLWMDQYYYVFGFTLIVFIILLITCVEITVLMVYYQLCGENHQWWWFSLCSGGSVAFYTFFYSIVWFHSLHPSNIFITYLLYFGYMFLISLAMFMSTGMVGAMASLWFVRKIFGSIKVD